MRHVLTSVERDVREMSVDRRKIFGGIAASLVGLAAKGTEAREVRRGECVGCRTNAGCLKKFRCVRGRCIPRGYPLVCGGAYKVCQNGKLPECNSGTAVCPGNKPATPYCPR
jgi:hypothetical protein